MKRIAKFEKVSFEQFLEGWGNTLEITDEKNIRDIYDAVRLPERATAGSAGYDFFAPVSITLKPGETIKIPTGIRVWMEPEWVLKCYTDCSSIIQWGLLTVITIIPIMRDTFLQRLQMTAMKIKHSA